MTKADEQSVTPSEALRDLLEWSVNLPDWQRNALRCLAAGSLTNENIADTIELCRLEHGLEAGGGTYLSGTSSHPPSCVMLAAEHLPESIEVDAPVSLVSLSNVENVNALAPNQEILFADSGVTVIYGDNACGKSGYGRILKKACRAREKEGPLLTNILDQSSEIDAPRTATIRFRVGNEEEPRRYDWTDGGPTAPELPFVQFFDSGCARVQVRDNNEFPFTPLALDLLQRLVNLHGLVKEQLQAERVGVASQLPKSIPRALGQAEKPGSAPRAPALPVGTRAYEFLRKIDTSTTKEEAEAIATLTAGESARLKHLEGVLADSPGVAIGLRKENISRLDAALSHVALVRDHCSDAALSGILGLARGAVAKDTAARLAADKLFSEQPLPGVASSTWLALWSAAREYSAHAYPGAAFPVTDDDALCVLCQQPLGTEGSSRVQNFEDFVQGAAKAAAVVAHADLKRSLSPLESLGFPRFSGASTTLPGESADLQNTVRRYSTLGRLRIRQLKQHMAREVSSDAYSPLPADPTHELEALKARFQTEVNELEGALAAGSTKRENLVRENSELEARSRLLPLLPDILERLCIERTLAQLDKAIASTDTTRISRKVTTITKSAITNRVRAQFATELQDLGGRFTPIELNQVSSSQGAPRFRAQLLASPREDVARVLSEGEHTCVALAGFLTELSIAGHKSALIFDDPVSSLDHTWRGKVADRLVVEGRDRQVVIFTHDAVFLINLMECAKRAGVPLTCHHLTRSRKVTGLVLNDAPWVAMPVKKRLGVLRGRLQDARAIFNKQDMETYALQATTIYDLLRKTWERAIEEVLLNGAVMRFQRGVETKRIKALVDITEVDYQRIERAMSKCSECVHDEAAAINTSMPEPDQVAEDIADLNDWVAEIRGRR